MAERDSLISIRPLKMDQSAYAEQGTEVSGYEEQGPYHCEDCVHKTAMDEPFCIHPVVIVDPKMKNRLKKISGRTVAKVNLERGCCKYVKQEAHGEDEEE